MQKKNNQTHGYFLKDSISKEQVNGPLLFRRASNAQGHHDPSCFLANDVLANDVRHPSPLGISKITKTIEKQSRKTMNNMKNIFDKMKIFQFWTIVIFEMFVHVGTFCHVKLNKDFAGIIFGKILDPIRGYHSLRNRT